MACPSILKLGESDPVRTLLQLWSRLYLTPTAFLILHLPPLSPLQTQLFMSLYCALSEVTDTESTRCLTRSINIRARIIWDRAGDAALPWLRLNSIKALDMLVV